MHFAIPTITTLLSLSTLISATTYSITLYNGPDRTGKSITRDGREYGTCYDIKREDFNDNIGSVYWPDDKQCIFWQDWGCRGWHTEARHNSMSQTDTWKGTISSYTCCPNGDWCPGYSPN
jgi:hypothetical protein